MLPLFGVSRITRYGCTVLMSPITAYLYEIKQTVNIEGEMVALVGRKNMTMKRSSAGNTLTADDLIDAMLVGTKVDQG